MRQASRRTARRHWAAILDCDPEAVFAPGTTVTIWNEPDVEFLCWDGGAIVGGPAELVDSLRTTVDEIPFDLNRDGARNLVASTTPVDRVLGPQFVGYCDESTFDPVESDAQRVDPRRLESLRTACSPEEWEQSGLSVDADTDATTFAVTTEGDPVAAVQYGTEDGVAKLSVASHPSFRGEGYATAAVSAAAGHAFDRALLAEYRTVERWYDSVALAERLGFQGVARSLFVRPA